MSKRRAATQLTKEDYDRDEEEEVEEPVPDPTDERSFIASKEVMERRSVIKAKRRTLANDSVASPNNQSPFPSPFAGIKLIPSASGTPSFMTQAPLFGGQSSSSSATFGSSGASAAPFSLGSGNQQASFKFGVPNPSQSSTPVSVKFGVQPSASNSAQSMPLFSPSKQPSSFTTPSKPTPSGMNFKSSPKSSTLAAPAVNVQVNGTSGKDGADDLSLQNPEYCKKLTELNHVWLSKLNGHSKESCIYDYTPLCNDYIRIVKDLDEKYLKKPNSVPSATNSSIGGPPSVPSIPIAAPKPASSGFGTSVSTLNSSSRVQSAKSSPISSPNPSGPSTSPSKPLIFGPAVVTKPTFGLSASASPFVPTAPATKVPEPAKESPKPFSFGVSTGTTSTASTASSFSGAVSSTASSGFSFAAAASSTPKFGTGFDPKASSSAPAFSFGSPSGQSAASIKPAATSGNNPAFPASTFSFGSASSQPLSSSTAPQSSSFASSAAKPFTFSSTPSFGSSTPSPLFSSQPSSSLPAPLFGSGTSSAATIGGSTNFKSSNPSTSSQEAGDDEEYVPPKVEEVNVEEKDAIYSKRIKLFKKEASQYEVVGLGMLHVKKLDTGKHQLIVRGENAIGSVWVNTILSPGVIIKKVGKKDVQIATVVAAPPPAADGLKNGGKEEEVKSVIFLFRCNSDENANELEEKLNLFKGAAGS